MRIHQRYDAVAPAREALARVRKRERFGIAAKRERRLAQHETVHDRVEDLQAQLEQIEFVVEREAVDDHCGSAIATNAAGRTRSSIAPSAIWNVTSPNCSAAGSSGTANAASSAISSSAI